MKKGDASEYIISFKIKFKKQFRQIDDIMESIGISPSMLAVHWIKTMFCSYFENPTTTARIFDIFFVEGIPFLINLALAMYHFCEENIINNHSNSLSIYIKDIPSHTEEIFDEVLDYAISLE